MPEHLKDPDQAQLLREQPSDVRRRARLRARQVAKAAAAQFLADAEKKALAIEAVAEMFDVRGSSTKSAYTELANRSTGGKRDPMHLQSARVNMSKGKRAPSQLSLVANDVGHSVRSLSEAVRMRIEEMAKADPERFAGKRFGCTHAQLSAAERGRNPIRRLVAEIVKDLTKRGPIPADPSRGIEAKPAYDGFPVESWKIVLDDEQ